LLKQPAAGRRKRFQDHPKKQATYREEVLAAHLESNDCSWWKRALPFLLCFQLSALFISAQQSQPLPSANPPSNQIVVYRGIRIDRNPLPIRYPVVLIEVHNELVFDGRNQFHALRIGDQEFPYSKSFIGGAVFELTPEQFAKTKNGDEVTILYGATNPIKRKLLKNWYAGNLDKTEVDRRPVKTFEGSYTDQITPETPIITVMEDNMFPPHWRDAPIKAQATSLSKKKVWRTFHLIYNALSRYYVSSPNNPKRVYLLSSLKLYGVECDAAYSDDTIYIVNSDQEEYTDEYLSLVLHRAFSNFHIQQNNRARDPAAADVVRFLPQKRYRQVPAADHLMKLVYEDNEGGPDYIYALEKTGFNGVVLFKQFKQAPPAEAITCPIRCQETSHLSPLVLPEAIKEHAFDWPGPMLDHEPVWSPDGKRIAFRSGRNHDVHELYVMKNDGSDLHRLTNTAYSPAASTGYSRPIWSPDSRRVAFVKHDHGPPKLFTVNADGSDMKLASEDHYSTGFDLIGWLQDGRILFLREGKDKSRSVYSILRDGRQLKRITETEMIVSEVLLSPDQSLMAIGNFGNLVIKDVESNTTKYSFNPYSTGAVSWSPDSKQIAFGVNNGLIVKNLESDTLRSIPIGDGNRVFGISWSPNGKRIAYVVGVAMIMNRYNPTELRAIDADATGERRLPSNGETLAFSPDGKYLVVYKGNGRLHLMRSDGSGERRVATGVWAKWIP
jgi:Tol biopolymer transport system component